MPRAGHGDLQTEEKEIGIANKIPGNAAEFKTGCQCLNGKFTLFSNVYLVSVCVLYGPQHIAGNNAPKVSV